MRTSNRSANEDQKDRDQREKLHIVTSGFQCDLNEYRDAGYNVRGYWGLFGISDPWSIDI